jgi:hypothetical protein
MSATRYSLAAICQKTLTWSLDQRRVAMPVCPQHENDRQGRGFIASLPIHATENRP